MRSASRSSSRSPLLEAALPPRSALRGASASSEKRGGLVAATATSPLGFLPSKLVSDSSPA
jgi:hypothetical protein